MSNKRRMQLRGASAKQGPALRQAGSNRSTRAQAVQLEKAQLREELEQATQRFLQKGGAVNEVPTGTSAWEPGTRPPPSNPLFTQPKLERTPVSDVVATIEARREAMKKRSKPRRQTTRSRRKRRVVYDDFGEPVRHLWVED